MIPPDGSRISTAGFAPLSDWTEKERDCMHPRTLLLCANTLMPLSCSASIMNSMHLR
jgi:hypothetical protein